MTNTELVKEVKLLKSSLEEAERRLSEHKLAEHNKRLQKLTELSITLSGEPIDIFKRVAEMIGELLDIPIVCLSEIQGDELYFLSVYNKGEILTNAGHCPISITPCSTVKDSKDMRIYQNVIEKFPKASFLKTHNAFSYCGFPSIDSEGNVISVTCLLDDKQHEYSDEDKDLLQIFAQRIGTEMERKKYLYESAVVVYDQDGKIMELYSTPEMDERYGIRWVDAVGRSVGEFLLPEQVEQRLEEIRRIFDTGEKMIVENVIIFPGGNFWHETSLSPMRDSNGNILAVVGFIRDITERKEVEEQLVSIRDSLQKQANHDSLTGLYNRHYMSEILDKEFSRALRYQTDLSCLLLDLDYFKDVNDSFGHAFGDMVLREFADCLKQFARKSDIYFRYGGEEFMLLLPNTGIAGARNVAEKIRTACDKKRYEEGNNSTTVTVSIGIASVKQHQLLESKEILALADKALYRSKAEGRNRVTVYMKDASGPSADEKTSEENNFRYLKEKLSSILEKTKKSSIESLELLTRDMGGEEHKQRNHDIKRYIRLIGRKLALPPTIIETFTRAANFHDNFKLLMGKSFIDRNKVLSRNEKIEIQAHPHMLSDMTELFDFFTNERSILLYHHENFDGTGYPGGLKENEIPLGARIFAITDAITSMLSERQYRPKLSPEEMVEELADKAGTQFDPMLVSLFIDIIEKQTLFPVPVRVLEKAREKVMTRKLS